MKCFTLILIIYHLLTEVKLKSSWILPNKSGEETSTETLKIEENSYN